ncbi:hypothetical protein C8N24_6464 [Solirubrobacter pauli]|uniref:Uncharacterized protein n=1 Tax=Solirubrobacter pauli TaxID=166793 RepID=A0A660KUW3_9ACTN|nr:hypothetical protein [Solirubrobacter pauli]RKQ84834.1 hypothetical protein C8N24_6464 [Solirubrobacter pauli]
MSDVPELRELVRGVAERTVRRRRRWLALRLAMPAAVAAGAAGVVLAGGDRHRDEVPAVTTPAPTETAAPNPFTPSRRDPSTPAATLDEARAEAQRTLGIFRRPPRASDRLAERPKPNLRLVPQRVDWSLARRVKRRDNFEEYLMPGLWDGKPGLCTVARSRGRTFGVSCSPGFPTLASPMWSRTKAPRGAPPIYFLLFPDGVERITLHLKSGAQVQRRVRDNRLEFQQRGLDEITWRDTTGREYRKRLVI